MIYIAAYLSLFMLAGHLVMGIKLYLKPMLKSNTEDIASKVMHAVFHYMTIMMTMSAIGLVGFAHNLIEISSDVVLFIGIFYVACGLLQIGMAFESDGFKGLAKMFQWTMFVPIGLLSILSVI